MIQQPGIKVTITWSKVMAFTILACAMALDMINTKAATAFMFAVPFVSALILGKQYFDRNKGIETETTTTEINKDSLSQIKTTETEASS